MRINSVPEFGYTGAWQMDLVYLSLAEAFLTHFSMLLLLGTPARSCGVITTGINMTMILPTSTFPHPDLG